MNLFCILFLFIIAYVIIRFFVYRRGLRKTLRWTLSRRGKRNGFIYFFRGDSPWLIKIGRTNNLRTRLSAHRTANPYGVRLLSAFQTVNAVKAESVLHKMFAQSRVSPNNEWFRLSIRLWLVMRILRNRKLTEEVERWLS